MAKAQTKTHKSKAKSSLILCCFGSFSQETSMESDHNPEKRMRWFSWRRTQKTKSGTKTVPLDASLSGHKRRAHHFQSSKSKSKAKSKSNTQNQKPSPNKSQTPATNLPPPTRTSPVVPVVPNQATSQQTRQKPSSQQNQANNPENQNRSEEDTRQESGSSPAMSRSVSLLSSKRQVRRRSSSSMQPQTTLNKPMRLENTRRYDPVVGMSAVLVTLVIMILWGRLCAILCTSAWFYFIRRFRMATEYDIKNVNPYSTNPDLDSRVYKKKVILEGILERNHRVTL